MDVLMAVDVIGRAAEGAIESAELRRNLGFEESGAVRAGSARPAIAASGRNAPSRSGAKPGDSGRNGAVSVTCSPIAARAAGGAQRRGLSLREARRPTMTDVALMRPRAMRSRIAALDRGRNAVIVGAEPDVAKLLLRSFGRGAGAGVGVA